MKTAEVVDLLKRELPKWPQMLVFGERVKPEVALEVIRRTDTFFTQGYDGNNRDFSERVRRLVRYPNYDHNADQLEMQARYEEFQKVWKPVRTEYVTNSWVSCSFIFGPHGWMQPDGRIQYGDNVGKWPSVEEIFDDWRLLAETFPFLRLDAVLMDGEGDSRDEEDNNRELKPVVTFRVRDGEVNLLDPSGAYLPFSAFGHSIATVTDVTQRNIAASIGNLFGGARFGDGRTNENAIPLATIEEWAAKFWK